jgi:tetratricopeptide (TPR) repeat protein
MGKAPDDSATKALLHGMRGDLLVAAGRVPEAIEAYKKAIEQQPDYMQPYFSLAGIFLRSGEAEKAIAQYQAALAQDPARADAHMILGSIYEQRRQMDLSEQHYRQALTINPDFVPAANNLAYLLADQKRDLDEALTLARKAKAKLPDDPGVMDTLGYVFLRKGLVDSAIGELRESAAKLPENPTVRFHLGLAYQLKGDPAAARQELEAALAQKRAFPEEAEARAMLSEL